MERILSDDITLVESQTHSYVHLSVIFSACIAIQNFLYPIVFDFEPLSSRPDTDPLSITLNLVVAIFQMRSSIDIYSPVGLTTLSVIYAPIAKSEV